MKPPITYEELKTRLIYDQITGEFRWPRGQFRMSGRAAGGLDPDGYLRIRVQGRTYMAHRLAWLLVHGSWPINTIDHINGDKTDNRIANLRDVPGAINSQNLRHPYAGKASSLPLGVSPSRGRFQAGIKVGGKSYGLGRFDTPELAHEAYVAAKRRHHPGCTL